MTAWTMSTNKKGFTILELAVVLTVIGLIIGFGVTAWISTKNSQQVSTVRTVLKISSECLMSYVIHSEETPPLSYFNKKCDATDPWGNSLLYENTGDNVKVANIVSKTFRDSNGDKPDAAWIVYTTGANRTVDLVSTPTLWDCSNGDDICHVVTKNALFYEIHKK